MDSFTALIERWPTITTFAKDIGVVPQQGYNMSRRNSIPADYWTATIIAAGERGIDGVDWEMLAGLRAKRYGGAEAGTGAA